MSMIAVLVNPRSRANRRNPRIASELQAIVGNEGRLFAPKTLEELDEVAAAFRSAPPAVIAVHGGDGTLHRALTAIARVFDADAIPPIAILGGGTMNVVAASLGIRERPSTFVASLAAAARAGRPPDLLHRRCMKVGTQFGFVFGNGLMSNFLEEYYGTGRYGPARAAWLLLRAFCSALIGGPFVRKLFRRFEGTVRVDGVALERTKFVGLAVGTVREVGLGFKLVHRADDDPERFGVLAIHAPPLALVPDFPAVHSGRGIAPRRAFSTVASTLDIQPLPGARMGYTIDGDLYYADGALSIAVGPAIRFVRPGGALIATGAGDTMARR
jgi:diacylglycerol kinase family enzyme